MNLESSDFSANLLLSASTQLILREYKSLFVVSVNDISLCFDDDDDKQEYISGD